MTSEDGCIIFPAEAEAYVRSLERYPDIKEIGSKRWLVQHEYLEKLSIQSVISAKMEEEEYIMETLTNEDKISTLIHELLAIEVWRQQIFSVILKTKFETNSTVGLYMTLYQEACLVNLLETTLYHRDACIAADETILDLVDYCYRQLTSLVSKSDFDFHGLFQTHRVDPSEQTDLQYLKVQSDKIQFEIALKCISLFRYISDYLTDLPLSVMNRMLNTHNVPVLLVTLLSNQPWISKSNGKMFKFEDQVWNETPREDFMKLSKIEGQLLMSQQCREKYEYNNYNKNQILKLRTFLNDVLIDQIPSLGELMRFVNQLAMADPPPPKPQLVIEQLPEIRSRFLKANAGKWAAIAKYQIKNHFSPTHEDMRQLASKFASIYTSDVVDNLLPDAPKCASCGDEAAKRCSQCKAEWYCSRKCQVTHWSKHKSLCKALTTSK